MKYLDEFRDPALAVRLVEQIRATATRRWVLMDVCGGQTHSLLRHGIEDTLLDTVELIHGPGCPVCVTPSEAIDFAIALAQKDDVILTTFGDMLRVPGGAGSLMEARSAGAKVRTVYAPIDAVRLAQQDPDRHYVFFAVGFETTAPATALAVLQAAKLGLKNFSLLVSHVRVLPAMESLMVADDNRVEGFLAAGHVCTVMGYREYPEFARRYHTAVVIAGFEPIDLLLAILDCIRLLESRDFRVVNGYGRSVSIDGNLSAQSLINQVYETVDSDWRGFGRVCNGGLRLREEHARFDARQNFEAVATLPVLEESPCRSADVLSGRIKPPQCSEFAQRCRPDSPLGAPMVSSEGACAAYLRYHISPRSHQRESIDNLSLAPPTLTLDSER